MLIDKKPEGIVYPPPSKSISHRGLICAALSGAGAVTGHADNEDTRATLSCLKEMGAVFEGTGGETRFSGWNSASSAVLDCGESGSTLRFLIPVAAAFGQNIRFTGHGRLMERPVGVYTDCFKNKGVTLESSEGSLYINGRLKPGVFDLPGDISSQFVTGLLLALPLLEEGSEIVMTSPLQSRGYADLTLDTMAHFGVTVEVRDYERFTIPGGQRYRPSCFTVERDFSAAAFFMAAAALGCNVRCAGMNSRSRQGDREMIDILENMGCTISTDSDNTLSVKAPRQLRAVTVDVSGIPDLVPPLAALMCYAGGESRIINAARLRIKESDRLSAVGSELKKLGADITEGTDFLVIRGGKSLHGGDLHAHNDHRIAMMAAVASIGASGEVNIDEPGCVAKSYPDFWNDFLKV